MRISPEVEIALSLAATEAARRRHEYMTVEHLLYALLFDDATAKVIRHSGGDVKALKAKLEQFLEEQMEVLADGAPSTPSPSMGVQRAIRRAAAHVQSSGHEEVKGANVLVAIFAEGDSFAVNLLEEAGVTRLDVIAYISHGVSKDAGAEDEEGEPLSGTLLAVTVPLNVPSVWPSPKGMKNGPKDDQSTWLPEVQLGRMVKFTASVPLPSACT